MVPHTQIFDIPNLIGHIPDVSTVRTSVRFKYLEICGSVYCDTCPVVIGLDEGIELKGIRGRTQVGGLTRQRSDSLDVTSVLPPDVLDQLLAIYI